MIDLVDFLHKVRLKPGESNELLKLQTLPPGTHHVKIDVMGNALLSTLYVKSLAGGASVEVQYYDFTTDGDNGEETQLPSHPVQSGTGTHRQVVGGIHNKPVARIIVAGGDVECSLYGTVVSYTSADLGQGLYNDGDNADLPNDKFFGMGGYNPTTGNWEVLKIPIPVEIVSGTGLCLDKSGLEGGSLIEVDIAIIPLAQGTSYEKVEWNVSCYRPAIFRIVRIEDAGGADTEKQVTTVLVNSTNPNENGFLKCFKFTSGVIGNQQLKLVALNPQGLSSLRGTITVSQS